MDVSSRDTYKLGNVVGTPPQIDSAPSPDDKPSLSDLMFLNQERR